MGIFRDIPMTYQGRDYTVTPSVRLLRMIEAKGRRDDPQFNLAMAVYRMTIGDVSHGQIAFILAEMINGSGGKTDADEAWAFLQSLSVDDLKAVVGSLTECFLAPDAKGQKPEAPET
jgi:hypothetical protein